MSEAPIIKLENVGVRYNRRRSLLSLKRRAFWALTDVSFDVRPGETLGVIGRNGAGKSTILRTLAGIMHADRGKITITPGAHISLMALNIGFLPELTGRKNAMLSGMLLGIPRRELIRRLDDIIDFAEIRDFIDEPVSTYSSGMKVRLGFSVALHVQADVILLDEVISVGDAAFREKSALAIRDVISSDRTVILVSHNADMVRNICDRCVWLEGGVSRAIGKPGEVLSLYEQHIKATKKAA